MTWGLHTKDTSGKGRVLIVDDEDVVRKVLRATLTEAGYEVVERRAVVDGVESVAAALTAMTGAFTGLVVTTGGTGFAPRDLTPEGTRKVLDRDAPGLAEAMRLVNPLGRLSRAVAGTRGSCIVLNTPGSTSGALECLGAVLDVLPHALALLADQPTAHET